jgi:triphosphoribosyl-dephospho-CoA synthase
MVDLATLVYDCFICDINALKPGNVGRHGAGHGMDCADFIKSAQVVTPILCNQRLGLGKRILSSVEATLGAVHCNTNLGMVLLIAPIIRVFEQLVSPGDFQDLIKPTLMSLEQQEAQDIFAAIRLANPGGLGKVDKYDVNSPLDIDIYSAMDAAKERDLIALQYANGYREIVDLGIKCLQNYHNRWNSVEWAAVACYLMYMASFPDSHIRRKYGIEIAEQVRKKTIPVWERFADYDNPGDARGVLTMFDKELKESEINPGTCADLTVASLLLYRLGVG